MDFMKTPKESKIILFKNDGHIIISSGLEQMYLNYFITTKVNLK